MGELALSPPHLLGDSVILSLSRLKQCPLPPPLLQQQSRNLLDICNELRGEREGFLPLLDSDFLPSWAVSCYCIQHSIVMVYVRVYCQNVFEKHPLQSCCGENNSLNHVVILCYTAISGCVSK